MEVAASNLFVDQNIVAWTTPFKILGANYGCSIDIPFAIVAASGDASLQPVLNLRRRTVALPSLQSSGGTTKGSIADIYVEPINLGWHFKYLDLIVSSGFFAPTGPYNPNANVNIGFGHWTGVFGLGGVVYADKEHTWSLSIYSHYLLYGSQMGTKYKLGDVVPFEWGAGKTFNLNNDSLKQITIGAVGYAQWAGYQQPDTFHPGKRSRDFSGQSGGKYQVADLCGWPGDHCPDQVWLFFFELLRGVWRQSHSVRPAVDVQARPFDESRESP